MPLHLPVLCGYCSVVFHSMPILVLGLQTPWGMDVVLCLDHFTCCKATCTLFLSNYRGCVPLKLTIVPTIKIYMCLLQSVYCGKVVGRTTI